VPEVVVPPLYPCYGERSMLASGEPCGPQYAGRPGGAVAGTRGVPKS
jgi:hypothetical protein